MIKPQRPFVFTAICFTFVVACNTNGSPEDGETDGDGWQDADSDETESCYPLPDDCPPLDRRCAEDGTVEQCREDGSGWEEATEQCGAEQQCDPETAECLCEAGYIPVLEEGTCLRVGPDCTDGFEPDGEGGCVPVLDECEEDEIPVIGGGCVQVGEHGDCGSGDYGNIPDEPGTEYVNTAYGGGDSNGTMDQPYTTIQEGLDAVSEEGVVAVAAGTYQEALVFQRYSALRGRCADMVNIDGGDVPEALWSITVESVNEVTIEGVRIRGKGVVFKTALDVMLRNCKVEDVQGNGIRCHECTGAFEKNTIMRAYIDEDRTEGISGDGIIILESPDITAIGNNISQVEGFGLAAVDSIIHIEKNRVYNTGDDCFYFGSHVDLTEGSIVGNQATQCTGDGILIVGGPETMGGYIEVRENIIQHVMPLLFGGIWYGYGIAVGKRESISISGNFIEFTALDGIVVNEILESTINRNVVNKSGTETEELFFSNGLLVNCEDGTSTVQDNTIRESSFNGIYGTGGELHITNNAVLDVLHAEPPYLQDGAYGTHVRDADSANITHNIIERVGEEGTCEGGCFGIVVGNSPGAVVESNHVMSAGVIGINAFECPECEDTIIRGNLIEDMGLNAINVHDEITALVENNLAIGPRCLSFPDFPMPFANVIAIHETDEGTMVRGNRLVCPADTDCSCEGIHMSGGTAALEGNTIRRSSWSGVVIMPNVSNLGECVSPGLATVSGNSVSEAVGVGLMAFGGLSLGLACQSNVLAEDNLFAGMRILQTPSGPGGTMIELGDCIEIVDDAYGSIINNRCLHAGRLGILFSDAAGGVVEGNEVQGTPVAGSIDGENPELVTRAANSLSCNGLDYFQENGGWPTPEAPWVGLP